MRITLVQTQKTEPNSRTICGRDVKRGRFFLKIDSSDRTYSGRLIRYGRTHAADTFNPNDSS
jgi:hypothetical protein